MRNNSKNGNGFNSLTIEELKQLYPEPKKHSSESEESHLDSTILISQSRFYRKLLKINDKNPLGEVEVQPLNSYQLAVYEMPPSNEGDDKTSVDESSGAPEPLYTYKVDQQASKSEGTQGQPITVAWDGVKEATLTNPSEALRYQFIVFFEHLYLASGKDFTGKTIKLDAFDEDLGWPPGVTFQQGDDENSHGLFTIEGTGSDSKIKEHDAETFIKKTLHEFLRSKSSGKEVAEISKKTPNIMLSEKPLTMEIDFSKSDQITPMPTNTFTENAKLAGGIGAVIAGIVLLIQSLSKKPSPEQQAKIDDLKFIQKFFEQYLPSADVASLSLSKNSSDVTSNSTMLKAENITGENQVVLPFENYSIPEKYYQSPVCRILRRRDLIRDLVNHYNKNKQNDPNTDNTTTKEIDNDNIVQFLVENHKVGELDQRNLFALQALVYTSTLEQSEKNGINDLIKQRLQALLNNGKINIRDIPTDDLKSFNGWIEIIMNETVATATATETENNPLFLSSAKKSISQFYLPLRQFIEGELSLKNAQGLHEKIENLKANDNPFLNQEEINKVKGFLGTVIKAFELADTTDTTALGGKIEKIGHLLEQPKDSGLFQGEMPESFKLILEKLFGDLKNKQASLQLQQPQQEDGSNEQEKEKENSLLEITASSDSFNQSLVKADGSLQNMSLITTYHKWHLANDSEAYQERCAEVWLQPSAKSSFVASTVYGEVLNSKCTPSPLLLDLNAVGTVSNTVLGAYQNQNRANWYSNCDRDVNGALCLIFMGPRLMRNAGQMVISLMMTSLSVFPDAVNVPKNLYSSLFKALSEPCTGLSGTGNNTHASERSSGLNPQSTS